MNGEYTNIYYYGIKYWILDKYQAVCRIYSMDCDPIYQDEYYHYPIIKKTEINQMIPDILLDSSFEYQCWVEMIGYPCCSSKWTEVEYQDSYDDWSYDHGHQEWCGLIPLNDVDNDDKSKEKETC